MQWIWGASNQNNHRELWLVSSCGLHFHSKRFQQGSQEVVYSLFQCMGIDKEAAFEAVQWPSAFSTIVSMSLSYSKLLNLSVACWDYSGPTVSLCVCDAAPQMHWCYIPTPSPWYQYLGWSEQLFLVLLSTSELQKPSSVASTFPTAAPCQTWFPINS